MTLSKRSASRGRGHPGWLLEQTGKVPTPMACSRQARVRAAIQTGRGRHLVPEIS